MIARDPLVTRGFVLGLTICCLVLASPQCRASYLPMSGQLVHQTPHCLTSLALVKLLNYFSPY